MYVCMFVCMSWTRMNKVLTSNSLALGHILPRDLSLADDAGRPPIRVGDAAVVPEIIDNDLRVLSLLPPLKICLDCYFFS